MGVTYALIIGIENYNQPKAFKKVSHAEKDANDIRDTFLKIGLDSNNIKLLTNGLATNTAIKEELKALSQKATKDDRLIFFYAGHGTYISNQNYIIPVDAYQENLQNTCIPISGIMSYLKKSESKKNLLFLDCCHSGFEPDDSVRSHDSINFLADQLEYLYKNEEFCCGFSSSKSSEKSISDLKLKNGVWSHFLIKALSGDAGNIYEDGILFNDKLQTYLNKEVGYFVNMNTDPKRIQTPTTFGNATDRFIIVNLSHIFEERKRKSASTNIEINSIKILGSENGNVKTLPDFTRNNKVPTEFSAWIDNFIKKAGNKLVSNEINELEIKLREAFNYKRRDIQVIADELGIGSINTPDFTYSLEIAQSKSKAGEYILKRLLTRFNNSEIILGEEFNKIFPRHFNRLKFEINTHINIENLIDNIEELDHSDIQLQYNSQKLDSFTLSFDNFPFDIKVSQNGFLIKTTYLTSPKKLISEYTKGHNLMLEKPVFGFISS